MTSNIGSSELIENMNQEGNIPEEVKEKSNRRAEELLQTGVPKPCG